MRIAVLTPTIPERADLLERCRQSVDGAWQEAGLAVAYAPGGTLTMEHFVLTDYARDGTGFMLNQLERLLPKDFDWVVPLADDDELEGAFFAQSIPLAEGADVVHSWPTILPVDPFARPMAPPAIPATALVRRSAVRKVGGWPTTPVSEDRALWERLVASGAVFREAVPGLWTYHLTERSKSNNNGEST